MTEREKIVLLSEKVKELNRITSEIEDVFRDAIREIYNGPGALVWQYRSYVPSMNFYTIRINKLLELDATALDKERITSVIPIKKFIKDTTRKTEVASEYRQAKKNVGKHW